MISNNYYSLLLKQKLLYHSNNRNNFLKESLDTTLSSKNNLALQRLSNNNSLTNISTWKQKIISSTPYVPSGKAMSFSMEDYLLSGAEKHTADTMNPEHYKNATNLINKINQLGELIPYDGIITSGYRSPERQIQIYKEKGEPPAMGSKHLYGHAIDISDPTGELKRKILNRAVLEKAKNLGLYFENFGKTPTWVHIQDEAPGYVGGQIWSADNLLERNNL